MLRTPLALAALLAPAAVAAPQYGEAWSFGYHVPSSAPLRTSGLRATPDGGVISLQVAWVPHSSGLTSAATVVKMTANGDRAWEVVLPEPGPGISYGRLDAAVAPNGDVVVMADAPMNAPQVLRYDRNGEFLWGQVVPILDLQGTVEVLPGGDVVVGGVHYAGNLYPYAHLVRYDAAGQVVWDVIGPQTYMRELVAGPGGRVAVLGEEDWLEEYQWGQVTVFESDGTVAWSPGGHPRTGR